jgi:16S rRNA (cytidine1402-2'-O)-methyltransferase
VGHDLALVSDAGTPGVSDPLHYIVRAALDERVPIVSLPGPSAVLVALTVSGLPVNRFVFEGFLPKKQIDREKILFEISSNEKTTIVYESPHRLKKLLKELLDFCGGDS